MPCRGLWPRPNVQTSKRQNDKKSKNAETPARRDLRCASASKSHKMQTPKSRKVKTTKSRNPGAPGPPLRFGVKKSQNANAEKPKSQNDKKSKSRRAGTSAALRRQKVKTPKRPKVQTPMRKRRFRLETQPRNLRELRRSQKLGARNVCSTGMLYPGRCGRAMRKYVAQIGFEWELLIRPAAPL